ncbi:MAG: DUF47 family protein [bacterium]
MSIFWGRGKKIGEDIEKYLNEMNNCLQLFRDFFHDFLGGVSDERLKEMTEKVGVSESRCDDIRHDIEKRLFSGALLPGVRGEIFALLEATDKVPNKAEAICDFIYLQNVQVPDNLKDDYGTLMDLTLKCTDSLSEALRTIFKDIREAERLVIVVDDRESDVDDCERALVKKIFNMDIELAQKMMLRDLVNEISAISDRAENASNCLEMLAVKRKA